MLKHRRSQSFNLAFLDVMSCGLGAVILLFMLVKFNAEPESSVVETSRLNSEIQQLILKQKKIELEINHSGQKKDYLAKILAEKKRLLQLLVKQTAALNNKNKVRINMKAELEKSIIVKAPKRSEDVIELAGKGHETYLVGMNVEGRSIGILIDNSASMSDEKLVEVIRRKFASITEKRSAPKWRRTVRVARWILSRVPTEAKLTVVSFNKDAHVVGPDAIISITDPKKVQQLSKAIEQLVPEEGTNLQAALNKIVQVNPALTNLYLITDGLPTLGETGSGLSVFSKCGSFFGRSKTISGECREKLFYNTVKHASLAGITVNIILLPLEGDPKAAKSYWDWASSTGGLLLSPAESWP